MFERDEKKGEWASARASEHFCWLLFRKLINKPRYFVPILAANWLSTIARDRENPPKRNGEKCHIKDDISSSAEMSIMIFQIYVGDIICSNYILYS
jgi:hypothetical protein